MDQNLEGQYIVERAGRGFRVAYWTDYWYKSGDRSRTRVVMTIKRFEGRGSKKRAEAFLKDIENWG